MLRIDVTKISGKQQVHFLTAPNAKVAKEAFFTTFCDKTVAWSSIWAITQRCLCHFGHPEHFYIINFCNNGHAISAMIQIFPLLCLKLYGTIKYCWYYDSKTPIQACMKHVALGKTFDLIAPNSFKNQDYNVKTPIEWYIFARWWTKD